MLFISHDLAAVRAITDRVVVLRDGRVVGEEVTADIHEQELVDLIVGAPARLGESAPAEEAPVEDQHAVALTLAAMESAASSLVTNTVRSARSRIGLRSQIVSGSREVTTTA